MKTKDRILEAAIKLFNEGGLNNVSIRDIAGEIGISSGNFAYHFKNKEALVDYFYQRMYDEVQIPIQLKGQEGFQEFHDILKGITAFMMKYSFFYSDMVDVFRMSPAIKESYKSNYEGRKNIYKGFLRHFKGRGLIELPNEEVLLDEITHVIWFTLTFWQAQFKILPADLPQIQSNFIIRQVWQILMPYMTDVGKEEYRTLTP